MTGEMAVVAARIRSELTELAQVVDRPERLFSKFQSQNDEDYLDGVALNLHGFYSGAERIFEEIAKEVDRTIPSGAEWHRNLLVQMSADVTNRRPLVIERSTRNCLEEYRGFRHVVRNVYTFNLRPSRLGELVTELRTCYQQLSQDLDKFCQFLENVVGEDET